MKVVPITTIPTGERLFLVEYTTPIGDQVSRGSHYVIADEAAAAEKIVKGHVGSQCDVLVIHCLSTPLRPLQ